MRTSHDIYREYLRMLELAGREAHRIVALARPNADRPVENTTHGLRPIQEWIEQADHLYQEYVAALATESASRN